MTTLGPYELLDELGRGGMGVVYRARDPRLGRDVALKTFLAAWRADPELRARFAREAQILARLNHAHVVRVHAYETQGERPYLVMDLLPGGSLKRRLRGGEPLPLAQALTILKQVGAGLAAAHDAGVLHRDLKPENVLFRETGEAVLTDFGLGRLADAQSLTQTGQLLGTPAYMPPEQATGQRDAVGPASDVYALGALGYALVTGQAPFSGRTAVNVLNQVLDVPPRPPRELRPDLPAAVEAVLLRSLSKAPGERHPSVAEFLDALESAQHGVVARRLPAWPALLGLAVLGAILLALAAASWFPLGETPPPPLETTGTAPPPNAPPPTPGDDLDSPPRYPDELEAALEAGLPLTELDPRLYAVGGSLESSQGQGFGKLAYQPLLDLQAALESAVLQLPPKSEPGVRSRLALVQVLHLLRVEHYLARSQEHLARIPEACRDWPLARYVEALQACRSPRPADLRVFYKGLLDSLTRPPASPALDQLAAQAAHALSKRTPARATALREESSRLAQRALEGGDQLRKRQRGECWLLLADNAYESARYLDARRAYDAATACDPGWNSAWDERAKFFARLDDREQALEQREFMSDGAVERLEASFAPGGSYPNARDTQAQLEWFKKEGQRLGMAGDAQGALRTWDKGRALAPKHVPFTELRVFLLAQLGDFQAALDEIDGVEHAHHDMLVLRAEIEARARAAERERPPEGD